jgi:4-amino-4-deoxy-L-arabinose transferase-like glycosyltransferase
MNAPDLVSARERSVVLIVGFVYGALVCFWTSRNGALGIPRNDDAFYIRTAFHFAETGHFVPVSSYPTLFGQVLISYPVIRIFGESISALQILALVIGVLGLCSLYELFRDSLSQIHSATCVLILGLSPIFANISMSFMTDIPAFSFQVFSLLLISKFYSSHKHNILYYCAASIMAFIAFSIRQTGITAVVTVIVIGVLENRRIGRLKLNVLVFSQVALLGSVVVFYFWRSRSPLYSSYPIDWKQFTNPFTFFADSVSTMGMTYGLYLMPIILLINPRKFLLKRTRSTVVGESALVFLLMFTFFILRPKPIGNYFSRFVAYGATVNAETYDVLSGREWQLLQIIGLVTTLVFCVVLARWSMQAVKDRTIGASSDPVIIVAMLTSIGFMALAFRGGGFDRYGLMLIPLLPAALIRFASELGILRNRIKLGVIAGLLLIGAFGLRSFDSSTVFDGAKWAIAKQEVDFGTSPLNIDGGYEWFAYHQTNFATTEIDKFYLWFKYNESPEKMTPNETELLKGICFVTRINNPTLKDQKIRELDKTGLFGWKVHLELQKKWECR